MFRFNYQDQKKGAALFLSVIILAFLLAIALGVSTILVGQGRMLQGMENSVQAFFAADTGIERALFEERAVSGTLSNGAVYSVEFLPEGSGGCQATNYCLKSAGTFRQTKRAIETSR